MTKSKDNTFIQVLHPVCCGLDVHKNKISACLITIDEKGKEQFEIREFSAFTKNLIEMKEWLIKNDCPIVAMESTGVYWHPVFNVLEESTIGVLLVNARHVKNVPGRKTDICDSKWLAGLLRHGLVNGSFIPPANVRVWRDLTRMRKTYTESFADYKRRVHKLLTTANIKIDSVVSDLFGVTGRNLIDLLCSDDDLIIENIEKCLKGSLKKKTTELYDSLQGFFKEHHKFQLIGIMDTINIFEKRIVEINEKLDTLTEEYHGLIGRLAHIKQVILSQK